MSRLRPIAVSAALLAALVLFAPARAQQVPDTAFAPPIPRPMRAAGGGPVVWLDEGHHNFHTLSGRFAAFGRLVARDGYVVRPHPGEFRREPLDSCRVLVISNALSQQQTEDWYLPTASAFTAAEIAAVRDWVEDGGALLLIADHMPFPGAAAELARAFGILFQDGFAVLADGERSEYALTRSGGGLAAHPITDGRGADERVDSVRVFTGQAFRVLGEAAPLLTVPPGSILLLPEEAWQFSKRTPRIAADGMLQGVALAFGRGRVAAFGEAAMFSAQLAGPQRAPMGMNAPSAPQNPRFVLNVMRWLAGDLPAEPGAPRR